MNTKIIHIYKLLLLLLLCTSVSVLAQPRKRLNESSRHHEWVKVKNGDREVVSFVVYPEVSEKAHAVLVIHENRGLTDWVCGVADQLAENGYIAIAPDLLSGKAPNGGRTKDFVDRNAARDAIYELDQSQVLSDLDAVFEYMSNLPAADGTVSVAGFCWGGSRSFLYSTHNPKLKAAMVFYGGPPEAEQIATIACPVYGFYGGNDARIAATIPDTEKLMKEAGKTYEPVVYEGAGHGFMRAGEAEDASVANKTARKEGWERWLGLLQEITQKTDKTSTMKK